MPAKKKILPSPCPICGRNNGTIQIAIFPKSIQTVVFRIGHYIREEYKPTKEERKSFKIDVLDRDKRKESTRGKVWHSFTIKPQGSSTEMSKIQDIIDEYESRTTAKNKKSISFSPNPEFYEIIKNTGWCMKPYRNYRGRRRKYSDYHFPKEEYHNYHTEEKQTTP